MAFKVTLLPGAEVGTKTHDEADSIAVRDGGVLVLFKGEAVVAVYADHAWMIAEVIEIVEVIE
jgi:hypothetical protein